MKRPEESAPALENAAIVVAHPDDEILWFGSLLPEVDEVVMVFRDYHAVPKLGDDRARAIAELPFETVCLAIPEAGSYGLADWSRPATTPFGLALAPSSAEPDAPRSYRENFASILFALRVQLASRATVFTHNPWGEYGHEDHVQIFRAVEALQAELGFDLWVSGYYSPRSRPLAASYGAGGPPRMIRRAIDPAYAGRISAIYKKHNCWTWADDWEWPRRESFIGAPLSRSVGTEPLPGLIRIDNGRAIAPADDEIGEGDR